MITKDLQNKCSLFFLFKVAHLNLVFKKKQAWVLSYSKLEKSIGGRYSFFFTFDLFPVSEHLAFRLCNIH